MTTDGNPVLVISIGGQWFATCPVCEWFAPKRDDFDAALGDRTRHHQRKHALTTR